MANLTHLWKVGQKVVYVEREFGTVTKYPGTVKEVYPDHVIADVPEVSDHCYFEEGFNLDTLYPAYNFNF